jgi:hypothetical protein
MMALSSSNACVIYDDGAGLFIRWQRLTFAEGFFGEDLFKPIVSGSCDNVSKPEPTPNICVERFYQKRKSCDSLIVLTI